MYRVVGRGFTLLEVLIAIGLVVALVALSAPVLDRVLDDRAFESAAHLLEQHLLLARAHAQAERKPIEVVYDPEPRRLRARWFEAGRRLLEDDRGGAAGSVESDPLASSDVIQVDSIPEPWAIQTLPGRARIEDRPPTSEDDRVFGNPADSPWGSPDSPLLPPSEDLTAPLRLAVFLPDGSILLSEPSWLRDDDGRTAMLQINPFTGVPRVELDAAPPSDAGAARERPDKDGP